MTANNVLTHACGASSSAAENAVVPHVPVIGPRGGGVAGQSALGEPPQLQNAVLAVAVRSKLCVDALRKLLRGVARTTRRGAIEAQSYSPLQHGRPRGGAMHIAMQRVRWDIRHWVGATLALTGAVSARAEVQILPYASAAIEHTSNVFYEFNGLPAPVGPNGADRADWIQHYVAGVDLEAGWSQQKLFVIAEGRRFNYNNFTDLDHDEGLADGRYVWHLTHLLDGDLGYRHERRMVPFSELLETTDLFMETEDIATAAINVQVAADWRVESRGTIRTLDSPREGLPNLRLREDSIHEDVRYLMGPWAVGADAEYLDGRFTGTPDVAPLTYQQVMVEAAAEYKTGGFSTFTGFVGWTRRTFSVGNDVSAVTGALSYTRDLTGKTNISVKVLRDINAYVTTVGSEIDTGVAVQLNWQATPKLLVSPGATYLRSEFPGQNFGTTTVRIDDFAAATLDLHYQVLDWLAIHPYGRYSYRSSTIAVFGFNVTQAGVELLAKMNP